MSGFQAEVLTSTSFPDRTVPEIRSGAGHLWVSWIDSTSQVGYSERSEGVWATPHGAEPYSGPDDVGPALMRVQSSIVSP